MPVVPAIQEVKIGGSQLEAQTQPLLALDPISKQSTRKRAGGGNRKALSSAFSPSYTNKTTKQNETKTKKTTN
jgi:hypothetical protein